MTTYTPDHMTTDNIRTVRDLIDELEAYPPKAEVKILLRTATENDQAPVAFSATDIVYDENARVVYIEIP